MSQLRNVRGGGHSFISDFDSTESKIFQGGLRNVPNFQDYLIYGSFNNMSTFHDKMNYERGVVYHSRSPTNQLMNFHFGYGGMKKFFVERYLVNHVYRKVVRLAWLPVLAFYTYGCLGMRMYDNAAHDYFYFSD